MHYQYNGWSFAFNREDAETIEKINPKNKGKN